MARVMTVEEAIERAELAQAANRILAVWRLMHLMIGATWRLK